MPIHPCMRPLYPPDCPQISARIHLGCAGNRCEWCGAKKKAADQQALPGVSTLQPENWLLGALSGPRYWGYVC